MAASRNIYASVLFAAGADLERVHLATCLRPTAVIRYLAKQSFMQIVTVMHSSNLTGLSGSISHEKAQRKPYTHACFYGLNIQTERTVC